MLHLKNINPLAVKVGTSSCVLIIMAASSSSENRRYRASGWKVLSSEMCVGVQWEMKIDQSQWNLIQTCQVSQQIYNGQRILKYTEVMVILAVSWQKGVSSTVGKNTLSKFSSSIGYSMCPTQHVQPGHWWGEYSSTTWLWVFEILSLQMILVTNWWLSSKLSGGLSEIQWILWEWKNELFYKISHTFAEWWKL